MKRPMPPWLWPLACLALGVAGCGDRGAKQRSGVAYNVDVTRSSLQGLKKYLDRGQFDADLSAMYDISHRACVMQLPRLLQEKAPADKRPQVVPKGDELRKAFQESVAAPLSRNPPDLSAASAGVDRCLAILEQIEAAL